MGNKTCKVVGFDIDAPSLQMIKNGEILGLAVQDPFNIGYEGMNQMMAALTVPHKGQREHSAASCHGQERAGV